LVASRHLLSIIGEILDISRLEAGRVSIDIQDFDLAAVVREVAAMVEPAARSNGNSIELVGVDGVAPIESDAAKVRQCLLNLVANANKFTAEGRIAIACTVRNDGEPTFVIEVRDTGIGIAKDKLGRLFQPFVQADPTVTRRFGGTGLGLAITRQLARALGGDVTAASVEGKGSTFSLSLPMKSQAIIAEQRAA
jgi:signal transduction histidine kinase